jgi:hypothetical protein
MRAGPVPHAGPVPLRSPAVAGGAVFDPALPARAIVRGRALGVDADGRARWLVRMEFRDAAGRATTLRSGGNIDFMPSSGTAQWQTRARFGGPATIVATDTDGPLAVVARAQVGVTLSPARAWTDTRAWSGPRVVAYALGPHEVRVGWFPRSADAVTVVRASPNGSRNTVVVAPPSSTYRDDGVRPGARYRYFISIPHRAGVSVAVGVPAETAHGTLAQLAGKAMWLAFSPVAGESDGFDSLDPPAIVAQAAAAGIRAIELRTTYGEFDELAPAARPTIDALLDAAAARHIAMLAWTVPRGTNVEDLAAEVRAARYRTASGHGFAALAVDLERGDMYLGDGARGYEALAAYAGALRAALGPSYPLVATVEDPYLEHLTGDDYPYAAIAASADALQPMAYWRMLSRKAVTPQAVRAALRGSFATLRRLAGRPRPIDVGGQTSPEGPRGAPPPAELAAAVGEAHRLGALGITFYDWNGTSRKQFEALGRTRW